MAEHQGAAAYPLTWPTGWVRTKASDKGNGRYQTPLHQAHKETIEELKKLGARHIVVSTNVELRRDGTFYKDYQEPYDTGVAVYWVQGPADAPEHRVIACDCWRSVQNNMRAIGLSVAALNALQRAGATQVIDRVYQGFKQLPASTNTLRRPWSMVLELMPGATLMAAEAAYKSLLRVRHPDVQGGSHELMAELNVAIEQARAHFKQNGG